MPVIISDSTFARIMRAVGQVENIRGDGVRVGSGSITISNPPAARARPAVPAAPATELLLASSGAGSTVVANTTAVTDYDLTYTLPARTVKAGSVLRVTVAGTFTCANAADAFWVNGLLGSFHVLLWQSVGGTTNFSTTSTNFFTLSSLIVFTDPHALVIQTSNLCGTDNTTSKPVIGIPYNFYLSSGFLYNSDNLLTVRSQWDTARAGNTSQLLGYVVEQLA